MTMELNPEQKRQLARVYAYILSLAAKRKQASMSQSLGDNEDTKAGKDTRQQTVIPSTHISQSDT